MYKQETHAHSAFYSHFGRLDLHFSSQFIKTENYIMIYSSSKKVLNLNYQDYNIHDPM